MDNLARGLARGRYVARLAADAGDLHRAQALRHLCFHGRPGRDADDFDAACRHVLIEDATTAELVCCYRLLPLGSGAEIGRSYSAQFYDLAALAGFAGPVLELGRFCIHPDRRDPDILRLAWGAMTRVVDGMGAELLFGCASFPGADADAHGEALALLRDRHLAPLRWLPRVKAPRVVRFAQGLGGLVPDVKRATLQMPPLLRTYLSMGGWVSDHAVVDAEMNTIHVFTGVEIGAIPPARARALRLVAAG